MANSNAALRALVQTITDKLITELDGDLFREQYLETVYNMYGHHIPHAGQDLTPAVLGQALVQEFTKRIGEAAEGLEYMISVAKDEYKCDQEWIAAKAKADAK